MAEGTYYSLLEIPEAASEAEIKAAYFRLIREVHPDRLANAPAYWQRLAEQKTKEINEAYSILSNREKRRLYDAQLAAHPDSAGTQTTSRARTQSSASSTSQQQRTSTRAPGGSGGDEASARTGRSSYQQQQAGSASAASSANVRPGPSRPEFASKMNSGQRFFFAVLLSTFAAGSAHDFWAAPSIGEGVFFFVIAVALFIVVVRLYQRRIGWALLALRVRRPTQQLWAMICAIALILVIGKVVSSETKHSALGIETATSTSGIPETNPAAAPNTAHLQEPPAISTANVIPANRLENGAEIRRRIGTNGLGELTVQNGNTEDAVVVLVNAANNRTIRGFYVRSEMGFTEERIPPGTYAVYFFTGSDWNPSTRSFTRDSSYLQFGKGLEFTETTERQGVKIEHFYDKHEITLQPVVGGNVSSSSIDRATVERLLNQPELVDPEKVIFQIVSHGICGPRGARRSRNCPLTASRARRK